MKGDPKVIEYLNKGLRSELTAINQYWIHYRMLDNWGYKDLAKKWRKELIEEMEHADKFTVRIIFLEGFPNMQVLDPLHIGQNVKEVLECDLQSEYTTRARSIRRRRPTAIRSQDYVCARPVRGADEGRGGAHRLPRDAARPRRQARPRALRAAPHRRAGRRRLTRTRSVSRGSRTPSARAKSRALSHAVNNRLNRRHRVRGIRACALPE